MTETDWQTCTDPQAMLEFLRESGRATDRKLRLFAVACCRRIWPLLLDERLRRAVEVAERHADNQADTVELATIRAEAATSVDEAFGHSKALGFASFSAAKAADQKVRYAAEARGPIEHAAALAALPDVSAGEEARKAVKIQHCRLLRDIFGSPVGPPLRFNASWHTPNAVALATAMYEQRDFSQMPALADALEAAGCADANILGHCRSGQEHWRGCWVIDVILGRE